MEDFDREIYGRIPKNTPKVNWEVSVTKGNIRHAENVRGMWFCSRAMTCDEVNGSADFARQ